MLSWWWICGALFVLFLSVLYILSPLISPQPMKIRGSHVLVTGGSSGIGKAIAEEMVKNGGNVTLLARNTQKLTETSKHLESFIGEKDKQKVVCISVDVSKDFHAVEKAIKQAEEMLGPVDMLFNCAGTSSSRTFEDTTADEFKRLMNINYFGSVFATKAVLPAMKSLGNGRIVFVSSQAGQVGVYGYTAYSASKFALRGLAESLQMELKPYCIQVTLAFPPDTDTPGFAAEQEGKPQETQLISEVAGLCKPEDVARSLITDVIQGKFLSYVGVDGYMLAQLTSGMSPVTSLMEATQQVVTMGIFRIISLFYLDNFDRIILKCKQDREKRSHAGF